MANIDILDSKIKKLRIELPHYSFSHSSSEESTHTFVGRKQIKEKLKKLVETTPDKTGVYLVTGNRGVGKTRLVNQVINETSLQSNSKFSQNLKYLFTLLFSVVITQFCLQKFTHQEQHVLFTIIFGGIFLLFFNVHILCIAISF
ncbi:MAG: ATP-binding protein [Fibromonadaceae bacterium]|jgi:AAA+ ATPase superfamily predicted ATPase|nr:ATP-binding protein [Fibromonadaceae bacterium]